MKSGSGQNEHSLAKNGRSFIVLKIPFVGHTDTPVLPFIGRNRPFSRFRAKQGGFTLIEVLTVIIIAGILAALAAPSLRNLTLNNSLVAQTNDLLADMLYMRSEALKRSKNLHMCKSLDPTAAQPACNATAADPWTSGWIIWADGNGDDALSYAAPPPGTDPDVLLRINEGFSGTGKKIVITDQGTGAGTLANEIIVTRLGLLGNDKYGYFSICDARGATFGRRIDVSTTGRARINRKDSPSC